MEIISVTFAMYELCVAAKKPTSYIMLTNASLQPRLCALHAASFSFHNLSE